MDDQTIEGNPDPDKKLRQGLFMSNIVFMNDLIALTKKVDHSLPKKEKLNTIKSLLEEINKQLPSFVYIPSDSILYSLDNTLRRMVIVKIETQETRIFPTKTKTNFSCCFQLISPEEYLMRNYYSYKENREKVIQAQLSKIDTMLEKQNQTPASLLVKSNIASQMVIMAKKKKSADRISEAPPRRLSKGSAAAMSNVGLTRVVR